MDRRAFVIGLGALLAEPLGAAAQQTAKGALVVFFTLILERPTACARYSTRSSKASAIWATWRAATSKPDARYLPS